MALQFEQQYAYEVFEGNNAQQFVRTEYSQWSTDDAVSFDEIGTTVTFTDRHGWTVH